MARYAQLIGRHLRVGHVTKMELCTVELDEHVRLLQSGALAAS